MQGSERKGRRGELDYRYDFVFHWAAESCSITKQNVIDSLLQENLVGHLFYSICSVLFLQH